MTCKILDDDHFQFSYIRYLEVAVGQYLGEGGMTLVGKLCPLLGGTGPATMVLVSLLNVYYCVIVGWAIFYLIVSLATLPSLPWDTCGTYYRVRGQFKGGGVTGLKVYMGQLKRVLLRY